MQTQNTLYIMGIDPGLVHTGWGIVAMQGNRHTHMANGTIVTHSKTPMYARLSIIDTHLNDTFHTYLHPYLATHDIEVAIEDVFVNKNPELSLKLGQARGVAMVAMARLGLGVWEYQNRVIKKSLTGSGKADKTQIQMMVSRLLNTPELDSEHSADALGIALTHAHMRTFQNTLGGYTG